MTSRELSGRGGKVLRATARKTRSSVDARRVSRNANMCGILLNGEFVGEEESASDSMTGAPSVTGPQTSVNTAAACCATDASHLQTQ